MKIIDMHCDTIGYLMDNEKSLKDIDCMINIEKLKKNDYMLQAFAMFVLLQHRDGTPTEDPFIYCNKMIDKFDQQMAELKDDISVVYSYQDLEKNIKENRISALLTIEEGATCKGDINKLIHFYNRGVRLMTITWNFKNELASPNINLYKLKKGEKPTVNTKDGLTEKGIEFIKKMNELGMIIDCSHSSDKTFYDVIKYSTKPIVCSHSNSRAICDFPRNVTDDMLVKLKENGGVIGINYCHDFTVDTDRFARIDDLIDHIDHIKEVIGIDYIGLGSDFDGIGNENIEMKDVNCMPLLLDRLKARGYQIEEIEKICFKNFLRVLKANM